MRTFRTVLELKIWERRQTFEEFVEYAEAFAREHKEPGTLGVRHLQRLVAGRGPNGRPLGPVKPATARLLEHIFGTSVDELLAAPAQPSAADAVRSPAASLDSLRVGSTNGLLVPAGAAASSDLIASPSTVQAERSQSDLAVAFEWLDERAGWITDTSRRKVRSRLARLTAGDLVDRYTRRAKVSRSRVASALAGYYGCPAPGYGVYRVRCGSTAIATSVLTQSGWLDVACPLSPGTDRVSLVNTGSDGILGSDGAAATRAVHRLAEAAALGLRVANMPLYRLMEVDIRQGSIGGAVALMPFIEYAVTMDLLESELSDALGAGARVRLGDLPLRDKYLPDLASVIDFDSRVCAGGVLALCAIARPADPYRGGPDYALLVQQRSGQVVNTAHRLAVIPKGFHQPHKDVRADASIGATLRRKMEEELFGRAEAGVIAGPDRVAAPMHPSRLSAPMRWLLGEPWRLRMECTGFGLNLVSGNYEFASLIVIDDEDFWARFGGQIEANWEAAGLRVYSSLDRELLSALITDETWSNEGLFALLQGMRRLGEIGAERTSLLSVEWDLGS